MEKGSGGDCFKTDMSIASKGALKKNQQKRRYHQHLATGIRDLSERRREVWRLYRIPMGFVSLSHAR